MKGLLKVVVGCGNPIIRGRFVMVRDRLVENVGLVLVQDFVKSLKAAGNRRE